MCVVYNFYSEEWKCEDLIEYSSNKGEASSYLTCPSIEHTSPKICFYNRKIVLNFIRDVNIFQGTNTTISCDSKLWYKSIS